MRQGGSHLAFLLDVLPLSRLRGQGSASAPGVGAGQTFRTNTMKARPLTLLGIAALGLALSATSSACAQTTLALKPSDTYLLALSGENGTPPKKANKP